MIPKSKMPVNGKKNSNKATTVKNRQCQIEQLNSEFVSVLSSNKTENGVGNTEVVEFLRQHLQRIFIWRILKWCSVALTISFAIYYVPILNWNASAVGRLFMIHFVKPVWNWEHLANGRCLIDLPSRNGVIDFKTNSIELFKEDCVICENLGNFLDLYLLTKITICIVFMISDSIDMLSNTTFKTIQNVYLLRNIPVVINDSHKPWPEISLSLHNKNINFAEYLQTLPDLMDSELCNIETNLLSDPRSYRKLRKLLYQITDAPEIPSWFLHFRNCEFPAVKSSRAIFGHKEKPYFLLSHLRPFHSSWILMSKGYEKAKKLKRLNVRDLVVVLQLSGAIECSIEAKSPCFDECGHHKIKLLPGQALLFMERIWDFYYRPISIGDNVAIEGINETIPTITFVQEIEWNAY